MSTTTALSIDLALQLRALDDSEVESAREWFARRISKLEKKELNGLTFDGQTELNNFRAALTALDLLDELRRNGMEVF